MMLFSHPSMTSVLSDQQYLMFVLTAPVVTVLLGAVIAHVPSYVAPDLHPNTVQSIIVAPVRQFLTFGAAVRAPGARTRPNAAPSTWCGSFMTKDRN